MSLSLAAPLMKVNGSKISCGDFVPSNVVAWLSRWEKINVKGRGVLTLVDNTRVRVWRPDCSFDQVFREVINSKGPRIQRQKKLSGNCSAIFWGTTKSGYAARSADYIPMGAVFPWRGRHYY